MNSDTGKMVGTAVKNLMREDSSTCKRVKRRERRQAKRREKQVMRAFLTRADY